MPPDGFKVLSSGYGSVKSVATLPGNGENQWVAKPCGLCSSQPLSCVWSVMGRNFKENDIIFYKHD